MGSTLCSPLVEAAKLNGIDPRAWPADTLARIATHPAHRLDEIVVVELDAGDYRRSARA